MDADTKVYDSGENGITGNRAGETGCPAVKSHDLEWKALSHNLTAGSTRARVSAMSSGNAASPEHLEASGAHCACPASVLAVETNVRPEPASVSLSLEFLPQKDCCCCPGDYIANS